MTGSSVPHDPEATTTGDADPWLAHLLASLVEPRSSPLGEPLPGFPTLELQRNTTGLAAEDALRVAHAFHGDVMHGAAAAGLSLQPESRVLDFGFGWGRMARVFMRDVRLRNIHGIDVDPAFAQMTREHFGSENFVACTPFPPTAYPDGHFDLVFSYSVFSHLSEAAARAWMTEFHRILAPGGVVALTTRHESFFDFCEAAARQPEPSSYIAALGALFPDVEQARAAYRRGEFVHASSRGVSGGGPREESFYGETWIPEAYARTGFGTPLRFVGTWFDPARYDQICFVLVKPA